MSEIIKDCSIKLFGKTITFPPEESVSDINLPEQRQSSSGTSISSHDSKDLSDKEMAGSKHEDHSITPMEETSSDNDADDSKTTDEELEKNSSPPNSPEEEEPSESSVSQEKELKKPDKILPCPRCTSKETKFCYFNNYNANQPRHFCKNCQRYWTAGGTMRNVPVGSGRRKNKNSSSVRNYGHLIVPDMFKASQADSLNGVHLSPLKPNGFFIFGTDGRTESMNHGLWEQSNRSSDETSSSIGKEQNTDPKQESGLQVFQGMPPPGIGLSYPQAPWPYQCSSSGVGPSGVPIAFYPSTTYWRCAVPNSWNGTCISPASYSGPSDISTSPTSSNLGKHFREGDTTPGSLNLGKENPTERPSSHKPVLIPKILRIDDPSEAAKSSIWSTLGSKNKKIGSVNGTSLFKAFESKGDRNRNLSNSMMVMRANPAALSRSLKFHESA